jgi:hypothetical protein
MFFGKKHVISAAAFQLVSKYLVAIYISTLDWNVSRQGEFSLSRLIDKRPRLSRLNGSALQIRWLQLLLDNILALQMSVVLGRVGRMLLVNSWYSWRVLTYSSIDKLSP